MEKLFVYGTLLRASSYAAKSFMEKHCEFLGKAEFSGHLYDLGGYPGAVPSQSRDAIKGELYEINEARYLLPYLDNYEGCDGVRPLFRREKVAVVWRNKATDAWIYLYNRPVQKHVKIESGDYLEYVSKTKRYVDCEMKF